MENNPKELFDFFSENQTQDEPQEENHFDPLAAGDMPETRKVASYEEMRDEAVRAYLEERKRIWIYLAIGILMLALSLCFLIGIGRHPMILMSAVFLFFSVWWIVDSIKKFPKAKRQYRYRLQRAVEIMQNANVFMEVPKEDLERFDGFFGKP